ncbi:MAG TPA: hypothetical protein VFR37_05930 [Longimicrobium sp.]|nr:hypothetical protein [Longimicrobium sp.]
MRSLPVLAPPRRFGQTARPDAWWVQPAVTFTILTSFVVYATWAALQNAHYTHGPYLSPLYSPELFGASEHAWLGPRPGWWPGWLPFSPALLILPFPGLFRFTCYYYRGAYYKAFWADPPSCAVGEPRKGYLGERYLPLVLQNAHRFFLYIALIFILILAYDAIKATQFEDGFGIGVGTLVLTANTILLAGYTFGCHSLRHLIGGRKDQLSKHPAQLACYEACGKLNRNHMRFAWASLVSVAFADVYVRLCSMGIWTDWRIL